MLLSFSSYRDFRRPVVWSSNPRLKNLEPVFGAAARDPKSTVAP